MTNALCWTFILLVFLILGRSVKGFKYRLFWLTTWYLVFRLLFLNYLSFFLKFLIFWRSHHHEMISWLILLRIWIRLGGWFYYIHFCVDTLFFNLGSQISWHIRGWFLQICLLWCLVICSIIWTRLIILRVASIKATRRAFHDKIINYFKLK